MATVTLRPSGDGTTTGWTRFAASGTFAARIVDDPDSNDADTSYVQSPNVADGTMFVELDDVPGDFNPDAINSITIKVAHRRLNTPAMAVDSGTVNAFLTRSDELTAISTTPTAVASPIQAGYALTSLTPDPTGTHSVTDWNGARLALVFDHTVNQTQDSVNQIRITAAEVTIDYTPSASQISGSSSPEFTASGVLTGKGALAGSASVAFSPAASLTGEGALAGSASVAFSGSGELTDAGGGASPIDGVAAVAFSGSGTLAGKGALAGSSAPAFTGAATLSGKGALAGSSAAAFSSSGAIAGKGALAGASAAQFSGSAALTGKGALAGVSTVAFAAAGLLTPPGQIAGASAAAFTASGTLTGKGALAGAANVAFACAGTIGAIVSISGSANVLFANTATLGGKAQISGLVQVAFTSVGTLGVFQASVPGSISVTEAVRGASSSDGAVGSLTVSEIPT